MATNICLSLHRLKNKYMMTPFTYMFYPILSFSLIILYLFAELDLSNNRISMLPGEMTNCTQLESIDISSNSFVTLPPVLAEMPSITKIIARKNYVAELDVEVVASLGNLATLNLEENPLNKTTYEDLERLTSLQILLSPRTMEEWEDLSI